MKRNFLTIEKRGPMKIRKKKYNNRDFVNFEYNFHISTFECRTHHSRHHKKITKEPCQKYIKITLTEFSSFRCCLNK